MIAQELEVSLHMAFMDARQKRHELITVEHLLLAMLDNPSASEVLNSCGPILTNSERMLLVILKNIHQRLEERMTSILNQLWVFKE